MLEKSHEIKIMEVLFSQHEEIPKHHTYEEELYLFELLKNGDTACIGQLDKMMTEKKFGVLSHNPLRNQQYLFVAFVTLAVRVAIEVGLEMTEAYQLSDAYILMMDECTTAEEVNKLHHEMLEHLVQQVALGKKIQVSSHSIHLCLDYIHQHLHERISMKLLSEYAKRSPSYLSVMFKKQVGMGIAEYIRKKRIKVAKKLLLYSEHSALEISNYLCFSSHSHFIQVFKKETGLTPLQYKELLFRRQWTDSC